jgi:hypothetical protein
MKLAILAMYLLSGRRAQPKEIPQGAAAMSAGWDASCHRLAVCYLADPSSQTEPRSIEVYQHGDQVDYDSDLRYIGHAQEPNGPTWHVFERRAKPSITPYRL